ncbi:MAG: TraB/GumN family protein [Candidatus Thermoplasmatota archaeon]
MEIIVRDAIILIGTAHISKESVAEVQAAIEKYKPSVVAVELCQSRLKVLTEKDTWENTPVTHLLKGNKAYVVLAQTFLASIQRRLGRETGVEPGSEMIAAIDEAKKQGIEIALVDRDITITLKRAWRKMGFFEKCRLAWELLKAVVGYTEEDLNDVDLQQLMHEDVISTMLKEFGELAPSVSKVLIDERDQYIAQKIHEASKKGRVVAVVGAGHLQGIKQYLEQASTVNVKELEQIPKKKINLGKAFAVAIPVLFASVIIWLLMSRGEAAWADIGKIFLWWFLIHGVLSAGGVLLARGHPLSAGVAFLAAPFTSLEPFFAPGWFAGLVEAKLRPPLIKDFQNLSKIESMKDFFSNKVIRLLMVVALSNLGSMIGTIVALPWILSLGLQ